MNSHSAYKNNHTLTVDYWPAILGVKKRPSQKRLGRFFDDHQAADRKAKSAAENH
jgi:hypothetical protein